MKLSLRRKRNLRGLRITRLHKQHGFFIWKKQFRFNQRYMEKVFSTPPVTETLWQKITGFFKRLRGRVTVLRLERGNGNAA